MISVPIVIEEIKRAVKRNVICGGRIGEQGAGRLRERSLLTDRQRHVAAAVDG